jgi:hypothetical protein
MNYTKTQSKKKKSKNKTWDSVKAKSQHLWVALGIIGITSLPYLHDLIPVLPEGEVFGYSSWRSFLWSTGMYVFSHLGWLFAYFLAKGKPYRFAILIPVFLSLYQIIIIFTDMRDNATLNGISAKLIIVLTLSVLLTINFFKNNPTNGVQRN